MSATRRRTKRGAAGSAVPAGLRKALADAPEAKAAWRDLTPIARMDFVSWIEAAKQPETRKRRVERACDMLATGKRRPCCYAIVPLDLHLALKAMPKAKTRWSELTSIARRDLIQSVEASGQKETRKRRIHTICVNLETGKPRR